MARLARTVLLLLALVVSTTQAQNLVADKLKKQGLTAAAEVWDLAGVSTPASNPKAKWTAFVPSNAAVKGFLTEMGLTMADLKARPGLAKRIVGSHLLLGSNVRAQEIFANGNTRVANTAAGSSSRLLLKQAGGKVTVAGKHGAAANVDPAYVAVDDNKTIHVVDKVLYGDGYYPSFSALCNARAITLSQFCQAAAVAGLDSTLDAPAGFDHTLFVPSNKAFIAAKLDLGAGAAAPSASAVADVLKYHVLAGPAQPLPALAAGKHETLLAGQSVEVSYKGGKAFVNGVQIVKRNVYVGKAIVQGVTQLLVPGKSATAGAEATTATSTAKPSASTTIKTPKGSISITPGSITLPKLSITPAAAAAAPKSPVSINVSTKAGRRMLLDFGWGASAGPTALEDASQQQIQAAVDGDESAADAGQQALGGSEDLSVPGTANLAEEGIYNW